MVHDAVLSFRFPPVRYLWVGSPVSDVVDKLPRRKSLDPLVSNEGDGFKFKAATPVHVMVFDTPPPVDAPTVTVLLDPEGFWRCWQLSVSDLYPDNMVLIDAVAPEMRFSWRLGTSSAGFDLEIWTADLVIPGIEAEEAAQAPPSGPIAGINKMPIDFTSMTTGV